MKVYDCVPGLEFEESYRFRHISLLVPGRDALGAALDAHVRLVLGQLLPARDAVWGGEALAAHGEGMGLAIQGRGRLSGPAHREGPEREKGRGRSASGLPSSLSSRISRVCGAASSMRCVGRYDKLKALDLDKATNIELLENFEETINTCRRMWEIHMYMMYGVYTAFVLFEQMTQAASRHRRYEPPVPQAHERFR